MDGLRALVTRPRAEAAELAAALERRGIAALLEPLIDIRFHDLPPPDLAGVQAILCTSANGVRALARLSPERALPLLAVGEATAARARAVGFAAVSSAGGNVDDLARLVRARLDPAGGRLLHVAGSAVAGDLAGALAGYAVERAVLYSAEPAARLSPAAQAALAAGTVDFALFFSPRTSAIFARLAAGLCLSRVAAVSISEAADRPLAGLGWRARRVAARPTREALLAALDPVPATAP
jgi:uroporphyrinogen-III synthase